MEQSFTVEVLIAGVAVASGVGRRKLDAERMAAATALELHDFDRAIDISDQDN